MHKRSGEQYPGNCFALASSSNKVEAVGIDSRQLGCLGPGKVSQTLHKRQECIGMFAVHSLHHAFNNLSGQDQRRFRRLILSSYRT